MPARHVTTVLYYAEYVVKPSVRKSLTEGFLTETNYGEKSTVDLPSFLKQSGLDHNHILNLATTDSLPSSNNCAKHNKRQATMIQLTDRFKSFILNVG
jgi:hypothetical protein